MRNRLDVLFYAQNGVGVGHVRRAGLLATTLTRRSPGLRIAILTSCSKAPVVLRGIPVEVFGPDGSGNSDEFPDYAREILLVTRPTVFVVDTDVPVPLLEVARGIGAGAVLIQRLIEPQARETRIECGYYDWFERVLIPHPAAEAREFVEALSRTVPEERIESCGYVYSVPDSALAPASRYSIILGVGGGGAFRSSQDGGCTWHNHEPVIVTMAEAIRRVPACHWPRGALLTLGVNLASDVAGRVKDRLARMGIEVTPWLDDFQSHLLGADLFVGRCGYNTFCDVVATTCPAVFVPKLGRSEDQRGRARHLRAAGGCLVVEPDGTGLETAVARLLADAGARKRMRAALACYSLKRGDPDIADRIMEHVK